MRQHTCMLHLLQQISFRFSSCGFIAELQIAQVCSVPSILTSIYINFTASLFIQNVNRPLTQLYTNSDIVSCMLLYHEVIRIVNSIKLALLDYVATPNTYVCACGYATGQVQHQCRRHCLCHLLEYNFSNSIGVFQFLPLYFTCKGDSNYQPYGYAMLAYLFKEQTIRVLSLVMN